MSYAGITDDAFNKKMTLICFGVYQSEKYEPYVYQRDIDDRNSAEIKVKKHLLATYSTKDVEKIMSNALYDASSFQWKPNVSPKQVVEMCRDIMNDINTNYR